MGQARSKRANSVAKRGMGDAALVARTGKDWNMWFALLDKKGAAKLPHHAIARMAAEDLGAGAWNGQMVAVGYERARGLRAMNQKCDGEFSVSVTRVMETPLTRLYAIATAQAKSWFPKGTFEETSRTKDKYWRGIWKKGRLEVGFYAKGKARAQIALQSNKLAGREEVEKERALWKKAMDRLQRLVETTESGS